MRRGGTGKQNCQGCAVETAFGVYGPETARNDPCNLQDKVFDHQLVGVESAIAIVHIQQTDGHGITKAPCAVDLLLQAIEKGLPVQQAGVVIQAAGNRQVPIGPDEPIGEDG